MTTTTAKKRQPFFYDVTLRDGIQALRHPWNLHEKTKVFRQQLGVQGIEVGYPGASEMDFATCEHLDKLAPPEVVISGLARAVERYRPMKMAEIYETALLVSEWSRVPIYEKASLVGSDVVAHRSGIHQDGAAKTKGMKKGAYRAIESAMIGRKEGDRLGFTSQSGKTAVFEIVRGMGLPITI